MLTPSGVSLPLPLPERADCFAWRRGASIACSVQTKRRSDGWRF